MKEHDPLNSVLREWEAPEPPSAVDARVRAAYRQAHRPSLWRRIWSAQVTIPVPVLAAVFLLLLAPVLWLQFRFRPPAPPAPSGRAPRGRSRPAARARPAGNCRSSARSGAARGP